MKYKFNFKSKKALLSAITTMVSILIVSNSYANDDKSLQYDAGEHTLIGNSVDLYFPDLQTGDSDIVVKAAKMPLPLPKSLQYNGLEMTYGEYVAMPDFFGIPEKPISDGKNLKARKERFNQAFNSLAKTTTAVDEVPKLLAVFSEETQLINDALKKGIDPSQAYKKVNSELNKKYNKITGGGDWYYPKGRMLLLGETNWD
ncbi:hypothetical protein [Facilibium subflavum]|uniref:hypothetical protein n=1 Tax=Facilibium subflavum TaxID=2219058 RepID=UPI000E64914B|nr:hypothetical protein [Facilibium subflavum]